jgi:hypothetical protein
MSNPSKRLDHPSDNPGCILRTAQEGTAIVALCWSGSVACLIFEPSHGANGRLRILSNVGFAAYESLEALQFCHENDIISLPASVTHIPISFSHVMSQYSDFSRRHIGA